MNDLISRKEAIDAVEKESQVDGAYGYMDTKSIIDLLSDLPSAQPKKGKWLPDRWGFWKCSACSFPSEASAANVLYKFCPVCGAKMEGEGGDENE